jgi:hypothetical protein
MTFKPTYTAEQIELLTRLWLDGTGSNHVTEAINSAFGSNHSRLGVLDKARRLGLKHPCAPKKTVWTDAQIEMLKRLWLEGNSATQTASALNESFGSSYSKNAVVGQVDRIKIKRPAGLKLAWSPDRRRATPSQPRQKRRTDTADPAEQTRRLVRCLLAQDAGRTLPPVTLPSVAFLHAA